MEFIAHVESHGRPIQGTSLFSLKQTYRRKIVASEVSGRLYGPRLSLQWLTKEARAAACGSFAVELDMENAHASLLALLNGGPLVGKYKRK